MRSLLEGYGSEQDHRGRLHPSGARMPSRRKCPNTLKPSTIQMDRIIIPHDEGLEGSLTEIEEDAVPTPSSCFLQGLSQFEFRSAGKRPITSTARSPRQAANMQSPTAQSPTKPLGKRLRDASEVEHHATKSPAAPLQPSEAISSPRKKRLKTGYEPPETFSHLNGIEDRIKVGLDSTLFWS